MCNSYSSRIQRENSKHYTYLQRSNNSTRLQGLSNQIQTVSDSSLAEEELKQITNAKFAYLSEIPSNSKQHENIGVNNLSRNVGRNVKKPRGKNEISKSQLEHEILEILRKHAGWIPNTVTNNDTIYNEESLKKIKLTAQELDLVNVSTFVEDDTEHQIEFSPTEEEEKDFDTMSINADDSEDWETKSPKEQIEHIKKITRTIINDQM